MIDNHADIRKTTKYGNGHNRIKQTIYHRCLKIHGCDRNRTPANLEMYTIIDAAPVRWAKI